MYQKTFNTPGQGQGRTGRGKSAPGMGAGPGGECICPNCQVTVVHQQGVPCYQVTCPKCGGQMTRKR